MSKPGTYKGRPIFSFVEEVKQLLREKKVVEAEELLGHLIQATEAESAATGNGVAPWYYGELAKIYHKRGDYLAEERLLERFSRQKHAPGAMPRELIARLEKARQAIGQGTTLQRAREQAEDEIAELFVEWREQPKE